MLPFDYKTLVLTALVDNAMTHVGTSGINVVPEVQAVAERFGLIVTEQQVADAYLFQQRRRLVYAIFTPIETVMLQILNSSDYFPESFDDFKAILGEVGQDVVDDHAELFTFWRQYASHVNARNALVNSAALYGAINAQYYSDNDYPTLYFKGIAEVDDLTKVIVGLYEASKDHLGFTPALPTPHSLVMENYALVLDFLGDELKVSLATLAGRFFFEGKPKDSLPGGVKLKGV